jgi:hypothetical protein
MTALVSRKGSVPQSQELHFNNVKLTSEVAEDHMKESKTK